VYFDGVKAVITEQVAAEVDRFGFQTVKTKLTPFEMVEHTVLKY
jgi:hypothetical protein